MALVIYYIDGLNFTNFGVYVAKSEGLLSRPKTKVTKTINWPDQHGETLDLQRRYYEARVIKLQCFIKASDKSDFVAKANTFLRLFDAAGTRRLMVDAGASAPLVYEVYLNAELDLEKTWSDGSMVGTFTLNLREPAPVKRVYRITGSSASLTITCSKALDIFWGDGNVSTDVLGSGLTVSHSYGSSGTYYIILAGDLDAITSITTSATLVWTRL